MKPTKFQQWRKRSDRIRMQIGDGSAKKPRMVVFCSNQAISVQVVDDSAAKTLASSHSIKEKQGGNIKAAQVVGKEIAEKAKAAKITNVIFDRNGYAFHGRVKALADAAREGGLIF